MPLLEIARYEQDEDGTRWTRYLMIESNGGSGWFKLWRNGRLVRSYATTPDFIASQLELGGWGSLQQDGFHGWIPSGI